MIQTQDGNDITNDKRAVQKLRREVERVKRAAGTRQITLEPSHPLATHSFGGGGRHGHSRHHDDDRMSLLSSRMGGAAGKTLSVAESIGEGGMSRLGGSAQAREIERKLYWYQDAIHEQELQQMAARYEKQLKKITQNLVSLAKESRRLGSMGAWPGGPEASVPPAVAGGGPGGEGAEDEDEDATHDRHDDNEHVEPVVRVINARAAAHHRRRCLGVA